MMRVVLIDDELPSLAYLRTLCEQIPGIEVVRAFNDTELFLSQLDSIQFDFVISDIVMPGYSGLQLAQLVSHPVIFVSAHSEFAAEAYDIEIVDYLRKPIQRDRLERAIEKVKHSISQFPPKMDWTVTTTKGKIVILEKEIVSFSANALDRRDKILFVTNGNQWVVKNKSFDQLTEEIKSIKFIRISKSELVNKSYILGYNGNELLLKNTISPKKYLIGEAFKKEVIKLL